jgi:hypothetical protein
MHGRTRGLRRWPTAVVIAVAALAVGALIGGPHTGRAASQAAPSNSGTPTISGTPQQGATLTADNGTWSGSPTSFAYAWSRCDKNGDGCAAISGASAKTYALVQDDVGHTIRVTVTASNGDGSGKATSAPSAVVSSASAPHNTAAPAISGTTQVGSTLTVSDGSWSGNPTSFTYSWRRCDQSGNSCATIGGAKSHTYQLTQADAGTTLRARVTAKNSSGSTTAETAQTAVVAALVSNGCPSGTGTLPIASVSPPARLLVGGEAISPAVVTRSTGTLTLHVTVTACSGRPVQGATIFATPVPYNQFAVGRGTTGADGTATMTLTQRAGFPASRHQQLLAVFVRATKPGEPILSGVSTRRLVTFRVSLR